MKKNTLLPPSFANLINATSGLHIKQQESL
jgi:hypothetical protein